MVCFMVERYISDANLYVVSVYYDFVKMERLIWKLWCMLINIDCE